jgi:tRNA dimethylallyltransferase
VTLRPPILAILGPTAVGKSALGIDLALRCGGEIVSCDSTAVYRGFDIGTDKVPAEARRGVPHHLIDVAEPTEHYTAARYAQEASAAIAQICDRGRQPILVGGTGLYYRALVRGLFPGPPRDAALRGRLESIASRKGVEALHRMVARLDQTSAARIHPHDLRRLVRALEVRLLTGRSLTEHFAATISPLQGYETVPIALTIPMNELAARIDQRVAAQFERGLVAEIRGLLARGVPESARPFGGLGYRQVLEHLHGIRDLASTRTLIAQRTRQYARRQLIWFRKEPNLVWLHGAGEESTTLAAAEATLSARAQERVH